jgi:hypothetical protein
MECIEQLLRHPPNIILASVNAPTTRFFFRFCVSLSIFRNRFRALADSLACASGLHGNPHPSKPALYPSPLSIQARSASEGLHDEASTPAAAELSWRHAEMLLQERRHV